MPIPALTRGLAILEFIILQDRPCAYSEIITAIPNITDSSLSRLLKSLLESGHLEKSYEGKYIPSGKIINWINKNNSNDERIINFTASLIGKISIETNESTAFGLLQSDHIKIIEGISVPDSIHIMMRDTKLHMEHDHAAALAVLDKLSVSEQNRLINGPYSKITKYKELTMGIKKFKCGDFFADASTVREGVSRLALAIEFGTQLGVVFFCLPTARLKRRQKELEKVLRKYKKVIDDFQRV
jgi:DNA-binding IclR family transcriptional regulator